MINVKNYTIDLEITVPVSFEEFSGWAGTVNNVTVHETGNVSANNNPIYRVESLYQEELEEFSKRIYNAEGLIFTEDLIQKTTTKLRDPRESATCAIVVPDSISGGHENIPNLVQVNANGDIIGLLVANTLVSFGDRLDDDGTFVPGGAAELVTDEQMALWYSDHFDVEQDNEEDAAKVAYWKEYYDNMIAANTEYLLPITDESIIEEG
jgi:hypothetical protein